MITYKKIAYKNAAGDTGFRYTKNNLLTKEATVPPEVMEKLAYADSIDYDEQPDKQRCLFCDAPQSRQRYLNGETLLLCEWHYQHQNLGTIAAQVRKNKEESDKLSLKLLDKSSKKGAVKKKKARSVMQSYVASAAQGN